jgi:alpha-mannosidase
MNNHWHTNYRAEQEGPTVFRYFIWPHDGRSPETTAARRALELSQPLLVLPARGEAPKYPPRLQARGDQGAAVVQVTAFKPSEDGRAWIVRLFNVTGKSSTAKLEWADPPPKAIWLSDNSEKPLQPSTGPIEVPARSLVTVRAEMP